MTEHKIKYLFVFWTVAQIIDCSSLAYLTKQFY